MIWGRPAAAGITAPLLSTLQEDFFLPVWFSREQPGYTSYF